MHLMDLAAKVKEGVEKAGLIGYRFNTIGVSDGMSNGTAGMSYSLQSRDIIADSIETVSMLQTRRCVEKMLIQRIILGHVRSMVRCQHFSSWL